MSIRARDVSAGEIANRLRSEARILAVSHEGPDGDALGCLSAMLLLCESLGVPCVAYVPGESPFPTEYGFLPHMDRVVRGDPPQAGADTTVYFLDCASAVRAEGLGDGAFRVNIDHHQDNPGYGDLNLLDAGAPSTTVLLYRLCLAGGFAVDAPMATALYVGLVADTGRFQYSNTSPEAHRVAAELQQSGCDVHEVYRRVYENVPLPKIRLLEKMLARTELRLGGMLVTSWLCREDISGSGANEGHTEGLIDSLRCVEGVRVAALARERLRGEDLETKVSLRSTDGSVNVAEIAHEQGGGGHAEAAGLTTSQSVTEVLEWIERRVEARL